MTSSPTRSTRVSSFQVSNLTKPPDVSVGLVGVATGEGREEACLEGAVMVFTEGITSIAISSMMMGACLMGCAVGVGEGEAEGVGVSPRSVALSLWIRSRVGTMMG